MKDDRILKELYDAYSDIINIIEKNNVNEDYILSAYLNAVKRTKKIESLLK